MHARNLAWILAGLVIASALVVAQDADTAPAPLKLGAEPSQSNGAPGSNVSYRIGVLSDAEQDVALSYDPLPDGLNGSFAEPTLHVLPGQPASTRFDVAIAPDAHAGEPVPIVLHATDASGNVTSTTIQLRVILLEDDSSRAPYDPNGSAAGSGEWGIHAEPQAQRIAPDGQATFTLVLRSPRDVSVNLSVGRSTGDGFQLDVEPKAMDLQAGVEAKAVLVVTAGDGARYGGAEIVATAQDADARVSTFVKYGVLPSTPPPTQPSPWGAPDQPPATTPPPPRAPSLVVTATPADQAIAPGGEAQFTIDVKSATAEHVKLGLGARVPAGYQAALADDALDVAPGQDAQTTLTISAPAVATAKVATFEIYAIGGDAAARAAAHVTTRMSEPQPTTLNGSLANGLEIALEGFEGSGGVKITLQFGDGKVMQVNVGEQLLDAALAAPTQDVGGATIHHSRLWLRFELGGDGSPALQASGTNG
jgi:hypothetical protein